jgi:hypothetical protein
MFQYYCCEILKKNCNIQDKNFFLHLDIPSLDVLSNHKVTSEHSPMYNNLTLILPTVLSILAICVATIAVIVYCKTRKSVVPLRNRECQPKQPNDVNYGYLQQRKNEEQYYAGPCNPGK